MGRLCPIGLFFVRSEEIRENRYEKIGNDKHSRMFMRGRINNGVWWLRYGSKAAGNDRRQRR